MSNRHSRRVAAVVSLAAALVAVLPATASAGYRERQQEIHREIHARREAIRAAEAKERNLVGRIARADARRSVLTQRLAVLEGKLGEARGTLSLIESQLDILGTELKQRNAELEKTLAELSAQQKVFRARVARIYIDTPTMFSRALDLSRNFRDIVSVRNYQATVVRGDIRLVQSIEKTKDEITAHREAIRQRQAEVLENRQTAVQVTSRIAALRNEQAGARAAVQREIRTKESLLGQVRSEKEEHRRVVRDLEKQSRAIEALLRGREKGQRVVKGIGGYMKWPVSGQISSGYGWRQHPIFKERSFHAGIDIANDTGTPVHAARGGRVLDAAYRGGYGLVVIIEHGDAIATVYAHLSRAYVRAGEQVKTLEAIGAVGSTGYATGPHLHFEVRVDGAPQNPMGWF